MPPAAVSSWEGAQSFAASGTGLLCHETGGERVSNSTEHDNHAFGALTHPYGQKPELANEPLYVAPPDRHFSKNFGYA